MNEAARRALLEGGEAEAVTVNQRALIDKILARYAAEFTCWRELIQNADDAGATTCELRFESVAHRARTDAAATQGATADAAPPVPDLNATLKSWVFKNDGIPFRTQDWDRLKRIAEGNPDPDRVGAFGVGFYSLFSVSEEPVVASGEDLMGFFWKGDSLFTRRAKSPTAPQLSPAGVPWTSFFLPLREPAAFPDSPLELCRFMATSLTFTTRVRNLKLYWDDQLLCSLSKALGSPMPIAMPSHLNVASPKKMMRVRSLESVGVQVDVEVAKLIVDLAREENVIENIKAGLASAFAKGSAAGGIASMLSSAFGRSSKASKEKAKAIEAAEASSVAAAVAAREQALLASKQDGLAKVKATIHIRLATATVAVSVDSSFSREIERSTKKPPPKETKVQVIAQTKDEYDASAGAHAPQPNANGNAKLDEDADRNRRGIRQIFEGVLPSLDEQSSGHVFIGFKTSQSSGYSGHIAARFIPTVEREACDFVDRYCALWNTELLSMGGYVLRSVYEAEMAEIGKLWKELVGAARPEPDDKSATWLLDRALHIMRFFTFRASTPSPRISSSLQESFFGAARQNVLTLASTRGIRNSSDVRFPNFALATFVKDLATLPVAHVEQAADFIAQVRSRGLVRDISMEDVFRELEGRALPPSEFQAALKWWISVADHPSYDPSLQQRLINSAVISVPAGPDGKPEASVQALRSVTSWLNVQRIPPSVPLPPTCLAYEVSKDLSSSDLTRVFGWSELPVPTWLRHLTQLSASNAPEDINLELSPAFAERVLGIVARAWGALPAGRQAEVVDVLKNVSCLPTVKGLQMPPAAYMPQVADLFPDLPTVSFALLALKGNVEKLLVALGVRRHIELQLVFDRLVATSGGWDVQQLLNYLSENKESLSKLELDRLAKTPMFRRAPDAGAEPGTGARSTAALLYEPRDDLRALGLPVLDWPGKSWRSTSDEAKFAFELGLRRHPPLAELLQLASVTTTDDKLRAKARAYLFDKHAGVYRSEYSLRAASAFAFVPALVGESKTPAILKPTEVCTNPDASVMGFAVVDPEAISPSDVAKLEIRTDPPASRLLAGLVNRPTLDLVRARSIFEYLASTRELSPSDYRTLKSTAFIPVVRTRKGAEKQPAPELQTPADCYFASGTSQQWEEVFCYIDFGPKAAVFLRECGVTAEPTVTEIAARLVGNPARFFQLGGDEAYLGVLRSIAANWERMPSSLRSEMKRSAFLLGSKRVASASSSTADAKGAAADAEELDDNAILAHDLKAATEVVIVDDATAHLLFSSSGIYYAPMEDKLQELYERLGSPRLSSLVEEKSRAEGQITSATPLVEEVKALVLERTPLFLFEQQMARSEVRRDAEWLNRNLEVAEVGGKGLSLTRTLRFGAVTATNVQRCSAMAHITANKKLTLYVASNMELDWYEVADTLTRHILVRRRPHEVPLYMLLLSTSLRNLKRRGFHVDRILNQRKADREAADQLAREEKRRYELEALKAKDARPTEEEFAQWQRQLLAVFPDAEPAHIDSLLRSQKEHHLENATTAMVQSPYPKRESTDLVKGNEASSSGLASTGSNGGLLSNWRSRLMQGRQRDGASSLAAGTSSIVRPPSVPGGWGSSPAPIAAAGRSEKSGGASGPSALSPSPGRGKTPNDSSEVTPLSNIRQSVLRAVAASRPDASTSIQSQEQLTEIPKETQNSYCDVTGVATDLRLAGHVLGMQVYLSPQLDVAQTLENNGAALERFIGRVLRPVAVDVFGVDPRALNVFCDVTGPSIAFNRGGTLFFNLRYYLAWHDAEVAAGNRVNALISIASSVSHELAHNHVAEHSASHEFYMQALGEEFFLPLAALVRQAEQEFANANRTVALRESAPLVDVS